MTNGLGGRGVCAAAKSVPHVRDGSFTTDAFSTGADQCPLLLQSQHYCSILLKNALVETVKVH